MLSNLFLGIALLGAEWVLYLLVILSIISVALIIERVLYYKNAQKGVLEFKEHIRKNASQKQWDRVLDSAQQRSKQNLQTDFETSLTQALVEHKGARQEILSEMAQEILLTTKVKWEKNLSVLASIGSNAPFVGLFGTVIGIIQAFRDIAGQAAVSGGAHKISEGLSDALVATAVGILVAIPATVAFNLFQRRVRAAITEAEAFKSFLISRLSGA